MAHGKLLMEKAGGEEQTQIPLGFSWLMLFFGPLVPLFRGQTLHFFFSVALLIPTISISWWTYPFFINFFWRRKYFSKGYKPVDVEGTSYDDVVQRTGIDIFEEPTFKHDSDRVFGRWLLFLTIQAVPILTLGTYMYQENQNILALRDENPIEYLERIKDRDNYWNELKELDPERYAIEWPAEQARREAKQKAQADTARKAHQEKSARISKRNAELAWEGELYSSDVPDGIFCSENYGGGTLEPHYEAHVRARDHIKRNLTVRGSGNFPVIDYTVIYIDPCTYTIHSWFDGRNAFNAKLREYYRVTVAFDDDEDGGVNIYALQTGIRSPLLRE